MKKTIYVKTIKNRNLIPNVQRYLWVEAFSEYDVCGGLFSLLKQLDFTGVVVLSQSSWPFKSPYYYGDPWVLNQDGEWFADCTIDKQILFRFMVNCVNEDISLELKVICSQTDFVKVNVNDNGDWYMIGSFELINDEYLSKCRDNMSDWVFKIRN